jgi:hypothetical protein
MTGMWEKNSKYFLQAEALKDVKIEKTYKEYFNSV